MRKQLVYTLSRTDTVRMITELTRSLMHDDGAEVTFEKAPDGRSFVTVDGYAAGFATVTVSPWSITEYAFTNFAE